jgi:hypothetical protein
MASCFLSPVTRMSSCCMPAFGIMQFSSILPHFVYPAVLLFFSRPSSSDISFQSSFWDSVTEHPYYMLTHSNFLTCMWLTRNVYWILVGNPLGKWSLGKARRHKVTFATSGPTNTSVGTTMKKLIKETLSLWVKIWVRRHCKVPS